MILKDSVRLAGLVPQMVLGAVIADGVYRRFSAELRVTSGNDSQHTGQPVAGDSVDPHYAGKAFDGGIHEIPEDQREGLVSALMLALGPEFVVLRESVGTPNEHVHFQYGHVA